MPNTDDRGNLIHNSVLSTNEGACPDCGSTKTEMRNYSAIWHEGDIHCAGCGRYVRMFDAG